MYHIYSAVVPYTYIAVNDPRWQEQLFYCTRLPGVKNNMSESLEELNRTEEFQKG